MVLSEKCVIIMMSSNRKERPLTHQHSAHFPPLSSSSFEFTYLLITGWRMATTWRVMYDRTSVIMTMGRTFGDGFNGCGYLTVKY